MRHHDGHRHHVHSKWRLNKLPQHQIKWSTSHWKTFWHPAPAGWIGAAWFEPTVRRGLFAAVTFFACLKKYYSLRGVTCTVSFLGNSTDDVCMPQCQLLPKHKYTKACEMGLVRIRHDSHLFATQSSHFVNRAGCQAKMASIEFCIPWRNGHKPHWSLCVCMFWNVHSMLAFSPHQSTHIDWSRSHFPNFFLEKKEKNRRKKKTSKQYIYEELSKLSTDKSLLIQQVSGAKILEQMTVWGKIFFNFSMKNHELKKKERTVAFEDARTSKIDQRDGEENELSMRFKTNTCTHLHGHAEIHAHNSIKREKAKSWSACACARARACVCVCVCVCQQDTRISSS